MAGGIQSEQRSIDWHFCLWAFYRSLPITITLTISSLMVVAVYEFKSPKSYEASSLVRLHSQAQNSLSPQASNIDLKTATQLVKTFLTVQEALKLIQEQKLTTMDVSESVRQHSISLNPQDVLNFVRARGYEPDLIRISVRHNLPEVAAVLANGIAEAFIARLNKEILAEVTDERRFIETQLKALRVGLQRLDKQILEFERKLSNINVPNEVRLLVHFVKIFSTELVMLEAEIRNAIRTGEQLHQFPSNTEHAALHQRFLEDFERRGAELEERRKFLTTLLQQSHRQLRRFPKQQRELSDLVRRLQVLGQAYTSLLSRMQSVQNKEVMALNSATIVNAAFVPNRPVGLGLFGLSILALSISLVVGIGITLLSEFARPSVRDLGELESIFGSRPLSVIPKAKLRMEFGSLMQIMTSRHIVAEAFRTLRANLRFVIMNRSSGGEVKVFLITSTIKGEGKSFVTASLGIAFAQIGKRVVIVDANLVNPCMHKFFGVDGTDGLSDVLKGVVSLDDALKGTRAANLQLLPSGTHLKGSTSITPVELFSSEPMRDLLQRLKERFDLVLIDTSPMMAFADTNILAPMADGVLVVVELERAARKAIESVKEQLELAQVKIIGTVVNKASQKQSYEYLIVHF
ncbi:MAG: polysaccharide biosynthesis tyrosine autokinase [Armatimonadetes bacterium]|nr:polysaccharide biosynthesis tyrosine autokinase [Armatimonadota bacterium]MCX7968689.1 polysaccharide biosynthesis tyrosine autokinase [Armatimonadota bacterium]MDW8143811.1 polysaccharide biosynthesis tyrosine autokinase [Armatimonadota bacterium]